VLQQVREKALREILRIVHGISAATYETVKRRPIGLAKLRSAACEISGSAWLLPAASTTLQRVEGNKSLRLSPFPTRVFTLTVCTKTAEEKQADEKNKISCSTRSGIRL
jgi:hypothetical protein